MNFFLFLLFLVSACSYVQTDPAPNSGFLRKPHQLLDAKEASPFQRGWASKYWINNRNSYDKIIVKPVSTRYLSKATWWQNQNGKTKRQISKDVENLASFFQAIVIDAYKNDPNKRLTVVNHPDSNVISLELAIVELVPAKAYFNASVSVAGFFLPVIGNATALGKGSIAIEGRVVDSLTGQIFAKFADRETDHGGLLIDLSKYTWYDGSKNNLKDWAEQLVLLINAPEGQKVEDSSPFKLVTW